METSWVVGVLVLAIVVISGLWFARSSLRIWRTRRDKVTNTVEALTRALEEVHHGDPAEAMRLLSLVLDQATDKKILLQANLMRGLLLSERGRHHQAVESFDACLRLGRGSKDRLIVSKDAMKAARRSYHYVGRGEVARSWERAFSPELGVVG